MHELEQPQQTIPKDRRFCTRCGEIKRLRYFEGESEHCIACCEKMLHTHVRWWSVPVMLVMLAAVTLSVYLAVQTVPYGVGIRRADEAAADCRLYDACDLYASAISGVGGEKKSLLPIESGLRVWEKYAAVYADAYSEYDAASMVRDALKPRQIEASPTLSALDKARIAYDETIAYVQSLNEKYTFDTPRDMPYDDMMADLKAHADASDSRYVKGYTAYFQASATAYYKQDDPLSADVYYDRMLELLPDEYMTVYTGKAENAMMAKAYDKAVEAYEAILDRNKNYTTAWARIAEAAYLAGDTEKSQQAIGKLPDDDPQTYRLQVRLAMLDDDLPAAQKLCARAQEAFSARADEIFNKMLADRSIQPDDIQFMASYISYNTVDAAVSLLAGDTQTAYQTAYEHGFNYAYYVAYISGDSSALTQPVLNMASLCASLTKNDESMQTIAQYGACDDATQQVIDGKLTLRDVFVERKAEIL